MQDYSITRCTRKCASSGRELEPGEEYVSVVLPDGETLRRVDIAQCEWQGPPEGAVAWWTNRMPDTQSQKLRPAPDGVLLDSLTELLDCPGKEPLAYLLAVLLVRRRVLTEDDSQLDPADAPPDLWPLTCPADGRKWVVPVAIPSPAQMNELQSELRTLLFTEQ